MGGGGLDACGVRFERRARPGIGSVPSSVVPVWMEPWGQAADGRTLAALVGMHVPAACSRVACMVSSGSALACVA